MDFLIRCTCGHAIDAHNDNGCSGERMRRCGCRHDRSAALNTAVTAVRARRTDHATAVGAEPHA